MRTRILAVVACAISSLVGAQKRHVQPSKLANQCAESLPWLHSMSKARAAAKKSGRSIFWYVPTLPNSPMDRKPILDLYMRSGFFSDPGCVAVLKDFVLLRLVPNAKLAKKYDLVPFRFIEPGFLVLDAKGEIIQREHKITTFSRKWFAQKLNGSDGIEGLAQAGTAKVRRVLAALEAHDVKGALKLLGEARGDAEEQFLLAAATFSSGKHNEAKALWARLAKELGQGPLAARAAAEAEAFGPISRGFWSYRSLPKSAFESIDGTTLPTLRGIEEPVTWLRRRSIDFLLSMQNEAGGFEDSNYDFGGLDSLPNVYVAVTALAGMALFECRKLDERCISAVHEALRYCLDPKHLAVDDKDEWIFAKIYTLQLISRVLASGIDLPEDLPQSQLREALATGVSEIFGRQAKAGSFRHEYHNPFVTAAVLLALKDAKSQKAVLPALKSALNSLLKSRTPKGAFSYYQSRGRARASVQGAAGRMPLCEAALFSFGKSSPKKLITALEKSFEHHDFLERTRKYDDHAGPHAYGGFFYWYDQFGRSMAIDRLGTFDPDRQKKFRARQRAQILAIPEIDGCFVDSHELGRVYGTAMALLCLARED